MAKFAMASGKLVDLETFSEGDILLDDIAHHLAKVQRFGGGMPIDTTYSVAEHCINLVQYAMKRPNINRRQLQVLLLHDASEAYLSDVVGPSKEYLPDYVRLETTIQSAINRKYLNTHASIEDCIVLKDYDRRIIMDEVAAIMPQRLKLYQDEVGLKELGCHIHYNNHPSTAKQCFLALAKQLGIKEKTYHE